MPVVQSVVPAFLVITAVMVRTVSPVSAGSVTILRFRRLVAKVVRSICSTQVPRGVAVWVSAVVAAAAARLRLVAAPPVPAARAVTEVMAAMPANPIRARSAQPVLLVPTLLGVAMPSRGPASLILRPVTAAAVAVVVPVVAAAAAVQAAAAVVVVQAVAVVVQVLKVMVSIICVRVLAVVAAAAAVLAVPVVALVAVVAVAAVPRDALPVTQVVLQHSLLSGQPAFLAAAVAVRAAETVKCRQPCGHRRVTVVPAAAAAPMAVRVVPVVLAVAVV